MVTYDFSRRKYSFSVSSKIGWIMLRLYTVPIVLNYCDTGTLLKVMRISLKASHFIGRAQVGMILLFLSCFPPPRLMTFYLWTVTG